jgi:hypothetical protein
MLAAVTLKRARRVSPHSTKTARRTWSSGVRKPILKATQAGAKPKEIYAIDVVRNYCLSTENTALLDVEWTSRTHTRSANESSSCPIMLLFLRHRATRPSMKSKNRPKGRKVRARYRLVLSVGSPRQYRKEEKTDIIPQNPTHVSRSSIYEINSGHHRE